MYINTQSHRLYAYTAGKAIDPSKPSIVFIHGVLNDHSVWILQSRYFAHHGFNVLAIDLPGHCKSDGEAPRSVEDAAAWVGPLLDACGIQRAALVGHSFGSLIALHAAQALGDRISHLALVGTAAPMKVSKTLLDASLNEPEVALKMINDFSRATLAPPPSVLGPGTWVHGCSLALGRRVLASNPNVNLFHRGFSACDAYTGAEAAIAQVQCPILFALGKLDQMTQPKAAQSLIDGARKAGKSVQVSMLPMGHHQMAESPEELLSALKAFLGSKS